MHTMFTLTSNAHESNTITSAPNVLILQLIAVSLFIDRILVKCYLFSYNS